MGRGTGGWMDGWTKDRQMGGWVEGQRDGQRCGGAPTLLPQPSLSPPPTGTAPDPHWWDWGRSGGRPVPTDTAPAPPHCGDGGGQCQAGPPRAQAPGTVAGAGRAPSCAQGVPGYSEEVNINGVIGETLAVPLRLTAPTH